MRSLTFIPALVALCALAPSGAAAADITVAQTFNIGVQNPGPGGGSAPRPGVNGPNTLQVQNGVPVLTAISPTSAVTGAGFTLSLTGNNFSATSVINFGGLRLAPTATTSTSLTAVVPASAMQRGSVAVSVFNPAPGGGSSAVVAFQVAAPANPAPAIVGVSPASVMAGSGAVKVVASGSGFIAGTTATLGGVSGVVSGGTIAFALPASVTANVGSLSGIIANPAPGGGSAAFSVKILNGPPTVSGFSPVSTNAGSPVVALTVTGTQFGPGSTVTLGGTPAPTRFVSATSLSATVPSALLRVGGNLRVGVTNPAPGGGSAAASAVFAVKSALPVLKSVEPEQLYLQNTGVTVMLIGTGFAANSLATIGTAALATVFESATTLTVTIPPALLAKSGKLAITVTTPAPGGGTSGVVNLPVAAPK